MAFIGNRSPSWLVLLAIVDLICWIKGYPYGQTLLFSGVAVFMLGAGVAGVGPGWKRVWGAPPPFSPLDKFSLKTLEAERREHVKGMVKEAKDPTAFLVGLVLIIAGVLAIALGALIMLRG